MFRYNYTQAQKLSNSLLCMCVQTSVNHFHETSLVRRLVQWSATDQHAISFTCALYSEDDAWEMSLKSVKVTSITSVVQHSVSSIRLQSAGSLPSTQTPGKCQRYPQKWLSALSVISQVIVDFLKAFSNFKIYLMKIQNVVHLISCSCLTLWLEYI